MYGQNCPCDFVVVDALIGAYVVVITGALVVGLAVGPDVGLTVGLAVGLAVGLVVGLAVGPDVVVVVFVARKVRHPSSISPLLTCFDSRQYINTASIHT